MGNFELGRYDDYKYLTGHDKSVKDFWNNRPDAGILKMAFTCIDIGRWEITSSGF
jgi:hypothetical protein